MGQWGLWDQWGQWDQWDQEGQEVLEVQEAQGLGVRDLGVEVGQGFALPLQGSEAHLHLGHEGQDLVHGAHHLLIPTGDQCHLHHQAWEVLWVHQACPQWDQWVQWALWGIQGHGDQWVLQGQVGHQTNNPTRINKIPSEAWT